MTETTNWADKECKTTDWFTPEYVLQRVRTYFGGIIPLDPASTPDNNTGAEAYYTETDNGLLLPWGKPVFINPPYGTLLKPFTLKIKEEAKNKQTIIALLPCGARFSTKYWQTNILNEQLNGLCFIDHRVSFLDSKGVPHDRNLYDSAVYGYNVNTERFWSAFSPLGSTLIVGLRKAETVLTRA